MNELRESFAPEAAREKAPETPGQKMTREQFEAEVEAHYGEFLRFASSLLSKNPQDQDAASAIVQEACLKAYQHLNEFRGDSSLKTYICSIIKNEIYDRHRKNTSKRRFPGERALAQENGDTLDPLELQPSREPGVFDNLVREDLERAVAGLPRMYRDIITMEVEEPDLEKEKKAQRLGISKGVYRSRLLRARAMMSAMMRTRGYGNR